MVNITDAVYISGWMTNKELTFLAETAKNSKCIVEVGCFQGRSTRAMADNTQGQIFAVDPWVGTQYNSKNQPLFDVDDDNFQAFKRNLARHIQIGKVIIKKSKFEDFNDKVEADFVFIDGDHRYDAVVHDINKGRSILKSGGILAGHDYGHDNWFDVNKAVDEIFPDANIIDTIWWVKV